MPEKYINKLSDFLNVDPVYLAIGEKWTLLIVTIALNLADVQIFFGILATISVTCYTIFRTLNQHQEYIQKKRENKKHGTPNAN